jgi:hypothetical protein
MVNPCAKQALAEHDTVGHRHWKWADVLTRVMSINVHVEKFTVPSDQEGAFTVWKDPRRRKWAGFHGERFRPSLMDLRHKAEEGEALGRRHEPRRFACGL